MTDNTDTEDLEIRELELRLTDDDDMDDCNKELIEEYLDGEADKLAMKVLQDLYKIRKIRPYIDKEISYRVKDDETTAAAYRLGTKIEKGGIER